MEKIKLSKLIELVEAAIKKGPLVKNYKELIKLLPQLQEFLTKNGDIDINTKDLSRVLNGGSIIKEEVKVNTAKDFVLKLDTEERFFAAVAIIFKGNKVLLGKSLSEDDRFGKLVFPGGHIEKDESPYMAAKREAKEETGIACKCRPLPIIEDDPTREIEGKENRKIAFVICDYVGGEIKPNEEFEWLKWVPLKDINWEEVYPQNVKILQALLTAKKPNL